MTLLERKFDAQRIGVRRGFLFILSSPSGAGKSTLAQLMLKDGKLDLSISMTTRQRRSSEVHGLHYYFVSREEFERRCDRNEFVEWAEVHGNYYGTLYDNVKNTLNAGRDMLFDIDYQGTKQLKEKMPGDTVSVFILPPSMKELVSRLHRRAEDSHDAIRLRLNNARTEIQQWHRYDYVIINEDLNQSLFFVRSIYFAEAVKRERCCFLESFVNELASEKID
ncbi:guanylate kinase [Bartonella ancashensis]|uniref:Guanylate kinase n=1 Tax=Bartonella ancashensis TaxID=1318743 RepID=A0A0M3T347_9HYPH|nr:guanylate kinase [Bartonella ancashensis]ALE03971.1 Guanylate kinase [Bartonella ancashensis]